MTQKEIVRSIDNTVETLHEIIDHDHLKAFEIADRLVNSQFHSTSAQYDNMIKMGEIAKGIKSMQKQCTDLRAKRREELIND